MECREDNMELRTDDMEGYSENRWAMLDIDGQNETDEYELQNEDCLEQILLFII